MSVPSSLGPPQSARCQRTAFVTPPDVSKLRWHPAGESGTAAAKCPPSRNRGKRAWHRARSNAGVSGHTERRSEYTQHRPAETTLYQLVADEQVEVETRQIDFVHEA